MYEREGLIAPYKKESRHRLYSQRDLERLRCVRRAINEEKISIEGIRRILALLPCWSIVQCPEQERMACEGYNSHTGPCWSMNHLQGWCAGKECRECAVYRDHGDCGSIKNKLRQLL
jgi:MerR family transcriptional regulator/heat shock protein HspR